MSTYTTHALNWTEEFTHTQTAKTLNWTEEFTHTQTANTMSVEKIYQRICSLHEALPADKKDCITLLRKREVIKWLTGDTEFLIPPNDIVGYRQKKIVIVTDQVYKSGLRKGKHKTKTGTVDDLTQPIYKYTKTKLHELAKVNEDKWSMELFKEKRPDLCQPSRIRKQKSMFGKLGEEIVKEYYILTGEYMTDSPPKKNKHELDIEAIKDMVEVKTGSYFTGGTAGEKIFGVPWKYADVPRLYGKPLLVVCLGNGGDKSDLVNTSDVPEREALKTCWENMGIKFVGFTSLLDSL